MPWDFLDRFISITDLFLLLFTAVAAWQSFRLRGETKWENNRLNQMIPLVLREEGGTRFIALPEIRRRHLTRSELLGLIGMWPMRKPGSRFSLSFVSTPDFFSALEHIQTGTNTIPWVIPCTPTEIDQFHSDCIQGSAG